MKKILVDTDIIIDYLRRKDKTNSLFFQIFKQKDYIASVCLITITELWAGKSMAGGKTAKKVEGIIDKCEVMVTNIKTAKHAGTILRETNYAISLQDAQIAASAIDNKIPLLTLNKKDFEKIKGIKLLD